MSLENTQPKSSQFASTGLCYLMCAEIPGASNISDSVTNAHEVYCYDMQIQKPTLPGYNGNLLSSGRVTFSELTIILGNTYTEIFQQKTFSSQVFKTLTLTNLKNTGVGSTGKSSFRIEIQNAKIVKLVANINHLVTTQDSEKISALKNTTSTPDHIVKALKINIIGKVYTWTYFPYSDKGEPKGNVVS